MKEIFMGMAAGIISGLGMGGGSILILFLTLFSNMDQHLAQATNLIFFIPTALAAIFMNAKQHLIEWKTGLLIGGIGMVGAIGGAMLANQISSEKLRHYFGIFLGFIAFYEIYSLIQSYRKKKKGHNKEKEIKQ